MNSIKIVNTPVDKIRDAEVNRLAQLLLNCIQTTMEDTRQGIDAVVTRMVHDGKFAEDEQGHLTLS